METETPLEHSKYLSGSPFHEAGFDSFTTAKVLIRLSARIEEAAKGNESPRSEDDIYHSASEDGIFLSDLNDLLETKLNSNEHALNQREQVDHASRTRATTASPSGAQAPSEVQAALDRQATLFRELGLDDQEPQSSEPQMTDRPHPSNNPYALLQETGFDEDAGAQSPQVMHTMMPTEESPFWTHYGNKLRVNGTVEEVCVIR